MRRFFDHTGDVGVHLTAATREGLFEEAALAFTETLTSLDQLGKGREANVSLAAETLDDLLVEWLTELLFRFEVDHLLVAEARVSLQSSGGGWNLEALLHGQTFDPDHHPLRVPVKGITYHQLAVHEAGGEWRTSVVFDI